MKYPNLLMAVALFAMPAIPSLSFAHANIQLADLSHARYVCYEMASKTVKGRRVKVKDCFRASSTCKIQRARHYGHYTSVAATTAGYKRCKRGQ